MRLLWTAALYLAFIGNAFGSMKIMVGEHIDVKELTIEAIAKHYTFEIEDKPIARATGFDHDLHAKKFKRIFSYESLMDMGNTPPDSLDYSAQVSAVEDQKNCGSCYDFAATATLVDVLMIKGGVNPGRVSYQYGLDCQPAGNYGCNGGTFSILNAFILPKGPGTWAQYPYTARQGRCQSFPVTASLIEWHYVGASNRQPTDDELMAALEMYGPLTVDIAATNSLVAYRGGVYNAWDSFAINHMIELVGYKKGEYWIIKNSWSTGWGEKGFGRLAWGQKRGNRINGLAETAAFVKVKDMVPPPVRREFSMENDGLEIKVTLEKENAMKVDDAKRSVQPFLDELDKR
jgi:hypothetical protein